MIVFSKQQVTDQLAKDGLLTEEINSSLNKIPFIANPLVSLHNFRRELFLEHYTTWEINRIVKILLNNCLNKEIPEE